MGKFVYDSSVKVEFEDRLLAHLQAVIIVKVRRGETFTFTWKDDISTGGGRTCVYIHSGVSLVFKFHGGRMPQLNPAWLHALTFNANSSRGLYIVAEPEGTFRPPEPAKEMVFMEVPRYAPPGP
ncbi:hypothetical protein [Microbacterium enclense]|uniref:DUF7882 domain-containing protein n=1 Tax=Microbacterium enclense TaxID=993073 RepID=A0A1G6LUZ4_9MICO|nr:hypothetical protein [Microbacterium enclense]KSU53950.1 ATP-dependent DNA ligase [Microbacterium enclense]SDC47092.1 hypothetical protein SAMN05216418_2312 [Microbacterium enclense]